MWYEVILEADDNGTLLVTVPAFPEPGAAAAIGVRLPWLIHLKLALYSACGKRRITRGSLSGGSAGTGSGPGGCSSSIIIPGWIGLKRPTARLASTSP